jgi:glucokinase-like ROK family protein
MLKSVEKKPVPGSKKPATAGLMRRINRSAVLDILRAHSPMARAEIARKLNMSLPTVMRIIDQLVAEDLVHPLGENEASGGRPRALLEFNGKCYAVIGIDLGGTKMFGTVADLAGQLQNEMYMPWGEKPGDLNHLYDLIDKLLKVPRPTGQQIRGIGIGAPGVTLSEEGIVTWAPSLEWRDLPLKKILEERYGMPVMVENDVNLAALGEYGFGAGRGKSSLVCIALGTGIGCGIVVDRSIYRGFHQSAGEIGYLLPGIEYLNKHYSGFGALENLASGNGIVLRARRILEREGKVILPNLSSEDVFSAVRAGEKWAQEVIDETVDYLSIAVGTIAMLLDPELIVLGGGVSKSADILIGPILKRLDGIVPAMPRLVQSQLGYRACVMGAIMKVLDATTNYAAVSRF